MLLKKSNSKISYTSGHREKQLLASCLRFTYANPPYYHQGGCRQVALWRMGGGESVRGHGFQEHIHQGRCVAGRCGDLGAGRALNQADFSCGYRAHPHPGRCAAGGRGGLGAGRALVQADLSCGIRARPPSGRMRGRRGELVGGGECDEPGRLSHMPAKRLIARGDGVE